MSLRKQVEQRRKDTRWIVGGLAVLLAALTGMYYLTQRSQDLPSELVTNRVLLFVLSYINLTLILAILFVLLRNLFKLVIERHNRILGSKFKTKLVATYIGLSLIPVLLLFAYGSRMMRGWIDRSFDQPAWQQAAQGFSVSEGLLDQLVKYRTHDTRFALRQIESLDSLDTRRSPDLQRLLHRLLEDLGLDSLAVYDRTSYVLGVVDPLSGLNKVPEPGEGILMQAMRKAPAMRNAQALRDANAMREAQVMRMVGVGGGEELMLTALAGEERQDASLPVVVAGSLLDKEIATERRQFIQAHQEFRQLEVSKEDIEAGYVLNFLMVALLILLASSWAGLYLARRITVPIQALAEATKQISEGDLDVQVDVDADDELGILIHSFNSMTAELQRNKELLEESNLELVTSNLRLAEERVVIAAVLQNVDAGVISVDEESFVLTCNGAALHMLGQKGVDVVGMPVDEAWSDPERQKLAQLFHQEPGASGRISQPLRLLLGGAWKIFEAKVTTMRAPQGQVSGRVMVLEELTELVKAQQMAAWSDAARRIAHEIKNPLTPIKLSAERLLKKHQAQDEDLGQVLEEGVEIITREVETMKGMVDEFSRFARMPQPVPTEVELGSLIDETLSLYHDIKPGVAVEARVEKEAHNAWLDGEQIKRALINLLDNAVEATEAPGTVAVCASKSNGNLRIRVEDNGRGIPPEEKGKLFLPHFSTKRRGTGLGLAIVHRIVSDHHGTIHADDNKPKGTVFTITLPQQ